MQNLLVGSASATCNAAVDRHRALQSVVLGQSSPSCTPKGHPSPEPSGRWWSFVCRISSRSVTKKWQSVLCLCWVKCCHRKVHRVIVVSFVEFPWCHSATHVADLWVREAFTTGVAFVKSSDSLWMLQLASHTWHFKP